MKLFGCICRSEEERIRIVQHLLHDGKKLLWRLASVELHHERLKSPFQASTCVPSFFKGKGMLLQSKHINYITFIFRVWSYNKGSRGSESR